MKVAPFTQALEIWQIALLLLLVAIVYILMAKINFPTKQLLAPILVLIVWNMTTNLTFTLDHWLLASASCVYDSHRNTNCVFAE